MPSAPSSGPKGPRSVADVADGLPQFVRNDVTRALAPLARAIQDLSTKEATVFDDERIVDPYLTTKTLLGAKIGKPAEAGARVHFEEARSIRDGALAEFSVGVELVGEGLNEIVETILRGQVDGILTASGIMITGDLREAILALPEYKAAAQVLQDSITVYVNQRVENTKARLEAACGDRQDEPATIDFGKAWDDLKRTFIEEAGKVHVVAKTLVSEKISREEIESHEEAQRVEDERVAIARQEAEARGRAERERGMVDAVNTALFDVLTEFNSGFIVNEAARRLDGAELGSSGNRDAENAFFEAVKTLLSSRTGRDHSSPHESAFDAEVPADITAKQAAENTVQALVAAKQLGTASVPSADAERKAAHDLFIVRRDEALRSCRQALLQRTFNGLSPSLIEEETVKLQALLSEAATATKKLSFGNRTEVEVYADLVRTIVASVGGAGGSSEATVRSLNTIAQLVGQIGPKLSSLRGEVREDNVSVRDAILAAIKPLGTPGAGAPIDADALVRDILAGINTNNTAEDEALAANISAQVGAQISPAANAAAILAELKEAGIVVEPKKPGFLRRAAPYAGAAVLAVSAWNAGDQFDLPDVEMPEISWPTASAPAEEPSPAPEAPVAVEPASLAAAPVEPAPAPVAVVPVEVSAPVASEAAASGWFKISDAGYETEGTEWIAELASATPDATDSLTTLEGRAFAVRCKDGKNGSKAELGMSPYRQSLRTGLPTGADKWETKGVDLAGYAPFSTSIEGLCADKKDGSFGTVLVAD